MTFNGPTAIITTQYGSFRNQLRKFTDIVSDKNVTLAGSQFL